MSGAMLTTLLPNPPAYAYTWQDAVNAGANNPKRGWNPAHEPFVQTTLNNPTTFMDSDRNLAVALGLAALLAFILDRRFKARIRQGRRSL